MVHDSRQRWERLGAAQRRTEEIYVTLRDRICLLHYQPGAKLSESELAAEFGVSRTPIRRSLLRLELEHLAERRQGMQTVVTSFDFASLKDVYVIRMILEEQLDRLSPAPQWWKIEKGYRELRQQCEQLMKLPDLEALGRLHLALQHEHAGIIENDRAREILMQLYFQIARIWLAMVPRMDWCSEVGSVADELDQSLEAIEQRDIRQLGRIRKESIEANVERMERLDAELELEAIRQG